jgi:hypothetical protein
MADNLYPDTAPGHQAGQAERLAIADLRLTRHLARLKATNDAIPESPAT